MNKLLVAFIIFVSAIPIAYSQCTKPASVTSTAPIVSVCEGVSTKLSVTATVAGASQNGGFTYSWRKAGTALTVPTLIEIQTNISTNIPDFSITSATLTDAGTYVLRIEDGSSGNASCYTEATTVIAVTPKPTISSAATGSICSGIAQDYTITSNVPSMYTWTRDAVAGISNSANTGLTNTITEVLTNTTSSPINVVYKITPTSTTGSCAGHTFDYTVTVNPKPHINSAVKGSVCSGVSPNYVITSNMPAAYTWTRAVVVDITPQTTGSSSTGNTITEILTNDSSPAKPIDVIYTITPTSTTGSCTGTPFMYILTVNPKPTITSAATGTTCTGVALNYFISSDVTSSYNWTRAAVTGVTPAPGAASTANPITEILAITLPVDVVYTIVPTSTSGSCVGTPFTYTVTATSTVFPTVMISAVQGKTICAGTAVTFTTIVTSGGAAPSYKWTSSTSSGVISTEDTYTSSSLIDGEIISVEVISSLDCAVPKTAMNSVTMAVVPNITPTVTVTADKTSICPGEQVTFTATLTNGGTAQTYMWKDGPTNVGTNSNTFTTTSLNAGNSISVEMTSTATCAIPLPAISLPVVVSLKTPPNPSLTIVSDRTTICEGNPVMFTATPLDGGTSPQYQWFIGTTAQGTATTNSTFTTSDLKGVIGNTVKAEFLSNADCANIAAVSSNIITISVNAGVKPGTLSSDQVICYGTSGGKITEVSASDAIAATYIWEQTTDPSISSWTTDVGTTSNGGRDFTPSSILTSDIYYRRKVYDVAAPAPCDVAYTTPVKITVNPDVIAGVINGDAVSCEGGPTTTITSISLPTGGSAAPAPAFTYVWESSTVPSPSNAVFASAAAPNTGTSYNPGGLTVITYFRRKEINSCKTVYSNVITKTITPNTVVDVSISDPGQICAGTPITLTATPMGGGAVPVYQWFKNAVQVGGTGPTYTFTPGISDDNSVVSARLISSEYCNTGEAVSRPVNLTIEPCGAFSSSINGPDPVTPGQQDAVYSVFNQTGFSYDWAVTGGTITSGQNSHSVTVDWDASSASAVARTTASLYSISVKETNKDKQSKTTTLQLNNVTTNVSKSLSQSGISLFPNPTSESFSIEMPESGVAVSYEILDLTGASVAQGKFISTGTAEKIATDFGAGMYQVVLRYNDVVTCGRLSKVQ